MFAVPGWSVSADALRPQINPKTPKPSSHSKSDKANSADNKSRKRKRGLGSAKGVEVTEENLGDLWRKHIEKKSLAVANGNNDFTAEKQKKKRKRERGIAPGDAVEEILESNGEVEADEQGEPVEKKKKKKKQAERERAVEETVKEDGQAHVTNVPLSPGETQDPADNGKAKFKQRKAKAVKKREQKALLQANGALPPSRPDPATSISTETTAPTPHKQPKKAMKVKSQPTVEISTSENDPAISNSNSKIRPLPAIVPNAPPPSAKLTDLQQKMVAKLTSSRFRHLNQTLYTSPSDQAMRLFTDSPQAYTSYHAGFRAQVAVWPQNPVQGFIQEINTRGKVSIPSQKKMWRDQKNGKKPKETSNGHVSTNSDPSKGAEPLPRNRHGVCTIADLGCGDATLAASLAPVKKSLNLNIHSFDLAKGDTPNAQLITVADITDLGAANVKDGSVDVAICCLSLMGTNWVKVVDECARAVRGGGEFWVAEIKSRFARPRNLSKGKKGDGIGKKKAKNKAEAEGVDEEPADLTEVEEVGVKDAKYETDVSAFVQVLRKKGFDLKGEPDMGNKMFVRMRYVKALRPERVVENEKGGSARFGDGFKGKQRASTKFVEYDDDGEVDESKVLKPCVYKTR